MKRKIILSLITISVLSFASCGNSTTEEPETTVPVETTAEATPEPTVTPNTDTVTDEVDTSSIDSAGVDSKIDEGDYVDTTPAQSETTSNTDADVEQIKADLISSIPKDIYDPDDFTTPASQQREKIENAYKNGLITDRQYLAAYLDTDKKSENGSTSSSTTGSTGSSTSGDTYIPAHGNPGTPMSNEYTGYDFEDEPKIDASNVTIN